MIAIGKGSKHGQKGSQDKAFLGLYNTNINIYQYTNININVY